MVWKFILENTAHGHILCENENIKWGKKQHPVFGIWIIKIKFIANKS